MLADKQNRTKRILTFILGLGIPIVLARAYQDNRTSWVSSEIESNASVLDQYWRLKATNQTELQFVAANPTHNGLAAARKYDEIMKFGTGVNSVFEQGVDGISPFAMQSLFKLEDNITDRVNEAFVFPTGNGTITLSTRDHQIYLIESAIYRHNLASANYARLVEGEPAVATALYNEVVKRYHLPTAGPNPDYIQLNHAIQDEAAAMIDECETLEPILRHGIGKNGQAAEQEIKAIEATDAARQLIEAEAARLAARASGVQRMKQENSSVSKAAETGGLTL